MARLSRGLDRVWRHCTCRNHRKACSRPVTTARPTHVHASEAAVQIRVAGENLSQAGAGSESETAFQLGMAKVSLDEHRARAAGDRLGDSEVDGDRGLPLVRQRGRDEKRPNVVIDVEVAQPGAEDPECLASRARTQLGPRIASARLNGTAPSTPTP